MMWPFITTIIIEKYSYSEFSERRKAKAASFNVKACACKGNLGELHSFP